MRYTPTRTPGLLTQYLLQITHLIKGVSGAPTGALLRGLGSNQKSSAPEADDLPINLPRKIIFSEKY